MSFLAEMGAIDWLGVLGSLMISGAYFAVSSKMVDPERPMFHLLNLLGASFILVSLYFRPNAGAIMIEVLWVCIAILSLVRYFSRRSQ